MSAVASTIKSPMISYNSVVSGKLKGCQSCEDRIKDKNRMLLVSDLGTRVVLRIDSAPNYQPYFARVVVFPEEHMTTLSVMKERAEKALVDRLQIARDDMEDIYAILEVAYRSLFNMTRSNWVKAGNRDKDENGNLTTALSRHHSHYHYIPRFEKPVAWRGVNYIDVSFADKGLSINPDHFKKEDKIDFTPQQFLQLKEDIQLHLVKEKLVPWSYIERAFPSPRVMEEFQKMSASETAALNTASTAKK